MNALLFLLSVCSFGQVCSVDSFPETILFPINEAQKLPVGIAMDLQGQYIALSEIRDGLSGDIFDCSGTLLRPTIDISGWGATATPAIAKAANGNFIVLTVSLCLEAQAFDNSGSALIEKQVLFPNPCERGHGLQLISVTPDRQGNYIAAWDNLRFLDGENVSSIFVWKLDSLGKWLGQEFVVDPMEYQDILPDKVQGYVSAVRASESGQIVLLTIWRNKRPDDAFFTYVVWLLDSDLRLFTKPIVATRDSTNIYGLFSALGVDDEGNFVVAWEFPGREWVDGTKPILDRIVAQRFSKTGEAIGPEIAVSGTPVINPQYHPPAVAMAADGKFLVVWEWRTRGVMLGQRFGAGGERIGRIFQVNVAGPGAFMPYLSGDRGDLLVLQYRLGSNPGGQSVGTRVLRFSALDFVRGDIDDNEILDLTDAIGILDHLFFSGAPPKVWHAGDVNDDGSTNVSDPIYLLTYLFLGGRSPPHPYPLPGFDPTPNEE